MMTSLLSIFDPSSSMWIVSNWTLIFFTFVMMMKKFWMFPSSIFLFFTMMVSWLKENFSSKELVFGGLFMLILNMNLLGLLPFTFSPTSHLSLNMGLAMTLWVTMILWYLKMNCEQFLCHLTPLGCPLGLAPFMVIIELVSSLIRPITLSLRLMANILAGHMILSLISKGVVLMSYLSSSMSFAILSGFLMFEVGVALIQSYVFSMLMFLYWQESDNH